MAVLGQQHPLGRVVEAMDAALDDGYAASLIGLDAEGTAQVLRALGALASRLEDLTGSVLRHAEEVHVEDLNGATSVAVWWSNEMLVTRPAAHRQVRLAEALGRYDRVREALCSGVANPEQASVVVRALDDLPEDVDAAMRAKAEIHLVALCDHFDAKGLRHLGRHILTVVAPELGEAHEAKLLEDEERRAREKTRLTMSRDGQGLVHGRFSLPELHGAMLEKAIQAIGWADQDPEKRAKPSPVQAGEALCELLERLDDKDLPSVGGVGATVVVTMTLETLQGGLAEAALDNGDRLSATTARRVACEAGILPVVLGGKGEVLDVGRRRRFHTRAQRIAIAQRDKHCQWTGCDAPPSRCHVHHLIPWARGGGTSVEQGRLYFPRHHHKVHELMEQSIRQQT